MDQTVDDDVMMKKITERKRKYNEYNEESTTNIASNNKLDYMNDILPITICQCILDLCEESFIAVVCKKWLEIHYKLREWEDNQLRILISQIMKNDSFVYIMIRSFHMGWLNKIAFKTVHHHAHKNTCIINIYKIKYQRLEEKYIIKLRRDSDDDDCNFNNTKWFKITIRRSSAEIDTTHIMNFLESEIIFECMQIYPYVFSFATLDKLHKLKAMLSEWLYWYWPCTYNHEERCKKGCWNHTVSVDHRKYEPIDVNIPAFNHIFGGFLHFYNRFRIKYRKDKAL